MTPRLAAAGLLAACLGAPLIAGAQLRFAGNTSTLARRSAGVETLADLRGKRIATAPSTSSAFYSTTACCARRCATDVSARLARGAAAR